MKYIIAGAVFIAYFIGKQIGVDTKFKCMSELDIAEYYQAKSGFPTIFRHLLCNEFYIVIFLIIFGLIYNRYLILVAIGVVILNTIIRFKADRSLPLLWWLGKRKDV